MIAVGTECNAGSWNTELNTWCDLRLVGGWKLKMLMKSADPNPFGVGYDGNVGEWTGTSWDDHGLLQYLWAVSAGTVVLS